MTVQTSRTIPMAAGSIKIHSLDMDLCVNRIRITEGMMRHSTKIRGRMACNFSRA